MEELIKTFLDDGNEHSLNDIRNYVMQINPAAEDQIDDTLQDMVINRQIEKVSENIYRIKSAQILEVTKSARTTVSSLVKNMIATVLSDGKIHRVGEFYVYAKELFPSSSKGNSNVSRALSSMTKAGQIERINKYSCRAIDLKGLDTTIKLPELPAEAFANGSSEASSIIKQELIKIFSDNKVHTAQEIKDRLQEFTFENANTTTLISSILVILANNKQIERISRGVYQISKPIEGAYSFEDLRDEISKATSITIAAITRNLIATILKDGNLHYSYEFYAYGVQIFPTEKAARGTISGMLDFMIRHNQIERVGKFSYKAINLTDFDTTMELPPFSQEIAANGKSEASFLVRQQILDILSDNEVHKTGEIKTCVQKFNAKGINITTIMYSMLSDLSRGGQIKHVAYGTYQMASPNADQNPKLANLTYNLPDHIKSSNNTRQAKWITINILKDGEIHESKEIRDTIKNATLPTGIGSYQFISSALNAMKKDKQIIKVDNGLYKINEQIKHDLLKAFEIPDNTHNKNYTLQKITNDLNCINSKIRDSMIELNYGVSADDYQRERVKNEICTKIDNLIKFIAEHE